MLWCNLHSKLTNEVSVLEVEAIQLVAGLFGIHDVLVHDEGRSLGIVGNALADLPRKFNETIIRSYPSDLKKGWELSETPSTGTYRIGPNLPKSPKRSSAVTL
jgi:hypothetical protein